MSDPPRIIGSMPPSADHAGGLNAVTLHESASAAQARWAAGYIRQHRHRRRFAWILAAALAAMSVSGSSAWSAGCGGTRFWYPFVLH